MRLFSFLVFLCLYSIIGVHGQRLNFEHYNDGDGLSHNSVRHIVQDDKGFLWLGTFSGLNRFDGYQFKSYTTSSEERTINNDDITALELDESTNELWIGTRNGLTLLNLDSHKFRTFLPDKNNPNSLRDKEVRSVYVDKFKRVWVGTRDSGVFIFHPEEGIFEKIEIEGFTYVKTFFEDKDGNLWIGGVEGGVAKIGLDVKGDISEKKVYHLLIPKSNKKEDPYINFIYEDFKSDIFVGTREGLYKFDANLNEFENLYIDDNGIRNSLGPYFISVAQASDGKYWIGTLGGLLVCNQFEDIEKGNFEWHKAVSTEDTSLIDNLVYALYFDAAGVLWIGTEDGLDKYDLYQNQFRISNDISTHINNQIPKIKGFAKTYDAKVVVATSDNGLFILNENEFVPLYNGQHDIASIYSIDGKTFYCGLWNGDLMAYDYIANSSKVVKTGIENKAILTIAEYGEDAIIVGSYGNGVAVLNKETFEIRISSGLIVPINEVTKIINTGEGYLWIATQDGMVKYDINTQEKSIYKRENNKDNGLPHNNVSDVMIDSENSVWAATRKGVAKYNAVQDRFETVSEFDEIKGTWATDIVKGNDDNLWINLNNNKIAKYNVKLKKLKVYHVNSGNRLDIFSSSGFYNFNNSRIYLGGKNGVIYFSPNEIKENKWSPIPIITEFKIQNKEIIPNLEVNGQVPLQFDLNYKREIELNYENRNFSIQFSVPSYSNERLNKFQYMLEGFDENWVETSSNARTIQYANLAADDYIFKIKGRNSDGIWSETAEYQIKVKPIFWLTYQGIALILIVLSILLYITKRQVKSRLILKNAFLEEKIKRERDEKLSNEKLRFFTNISHELRTPLTLILGPVKQLLEINTSQPYERSRANLINQNANRLLRLVNQILDFRRAETGVIKLKVVKADILIPTKNVFYSFSELAESKDISFNLDIEDEILDCWIDLEKYNKILYNLLSNAMKFTQNYGSVNLFVGVEEGKQRTLIIEVSDNGIGIPVESKEKIFSRFYQASNSKEITTGTGIGLSLVKALVELHKGEITVESSPKFGSIFKVRLPVYKDCFEKMKFLNLNQNQLRKLEKYG